MANSSALTSSSDILGAYFYCIEVQMENLLVILAIVIILFIVFRKFNLWYWKIQEMVNNQEKIISLLSSINSNASSTEVNSEEIAKSLRKKAIPETKEEAHWRDR